MRNVCIAAHLLRCLRHSAFGHVLQRTPSTSVLDALHLHLSAKFLATWFYIAAVPFAGAATTHAEEVDTTRVYPLDEVVVNIVTREPDRNSATSGVTLQGGSYGTAV